MTKLPDDFIESNLSVILAEISRQPEIGAKFPPEILSFPEQIEQLREYIEWASEYQIAYESIVCMLEDYEFQLSGASAVKLLEIGLLFQLKTDLPVDAPFDFRDKSRVEIRERTAGDEENQR